MYSSEDSILFYPSSDKKQQLGESYPLPVEKTQTPENPIYCFFRKYSVHKLSMHLSSQSLMSDFDLLQKIKRKNTQEINVSNTENDYESFKLKANILLTKNIDKILSALAKIQREKYASIYLKAPIIDNISKRKLPEIDLDNFHSISINDNLASTGFLCSLNKEIIEILSMQSFDFTKTWECIKPFSRYYIIFNYYAYQIYKQQPLNDLLTVNPENLHRTNRAFHDKIYLPFTLGLILIHKLIPNAVSEHVINFLINCFEKTRSSVSAYLEYDQKYIIEFQNSLQFRLKNKSADFNFNDFLRNFEKTLFNELRNLSQKSECEATLFQFLVEMDFGDYFSDFKWLIFEI